MHFDPDTSIPSPDFDSILFVPDMACEFTVKMGMNAMKKDLGGERSDRYSMYVVNDEVRKMFIEEPGKLEVSDAETMKEYLDGLEE